MMTDEFEVKIIDKNLKSSIMVLPKKQFNERYGLNMTQYEL